MLAALQTNMKASDVNSLIKGISKGADLQKAIHGEVSTYANLMKKKGSRIPLVFEEDETITLNYSAIERLLKETLSSRLSNVDLAYICDCLTMGEKVKYTDEKVQDVVFEIADPEINGGFESDIELWQLIENCKESS
jgi:hypothetical protein